MYIDFFNKEFFDSINLHDSIFSGFTFQYEGRQVTLECVNFYEKIKHRFSFLNVIFLEMQGCSFWNGGERVYGQSTLEKCEQLEKLLNVQQQNKELYSNSLLTKGIQYIPLEIELVSGDALLIICEKISYEEIPCNSILET